MQAEQRLSRYSSRIGEISPEGDYRRGKVDIIMMVIQISATTY